MRAQPAEASCYCNPVLTASCPDPFVLKRGGAYFCYATGIDPDGRCFPIHRSIDLVHWAPIGGAMARLGSVATEYRSPEVVFHRGLFYLYYSAGDGVRMELRAATSRVPEGPFVDAGVLLCEDERAVDPHVFTDRDGTRYMFYATDFHDRDRVGTGTVVDRMVDALALAGAPVPVTLPRFDWQIFDPRRADKGGVRWHALESPFVLERKRVYYQMFTGGNRSERVNGVSYARAGKLIVPGEWEQREPAEGVPLLLTTQPGKILGPGHNSVVRGPDNRQLFCIYDERVLSGDERVLAIDPLDWVGERLTVLGPTTEPQPAPILPLTPFDCPYVQDAREGGPLETIRPLPFPSFRLEATFRASADDSGAGGSVGIACTTAGILLARSAVELGVAPRLVHTLEDVGEIAQLPVPHGCDHWLRMDIEGTNVAIWSDEQREPLRSQMSVEPEELLLFARGARGTWSAVELTGGWEDLFETEDEDPRASFYEPPYDAQRGGGQWRIEGGALRQADPYARETCRIKRWSFTGYELIVNARLESMSSDAGFLGILPALDQLDEGPLLTLAAGDTDRTLFAAWHPLGLNGASRALTLPKHAAKLRTDHQLRFRKENGSIEVRFDGLDLGRFDVPSGPTRVGLCASRAAASFEMVRLTSLT